MDGLSLSRTDGPVIRADAVYDGHFVLPEQRVMPFSDSIDHLECRHDHDSTRCEWHRQRPEISGYPISETKDSTATMQRTIREIPDNEEDGYCGLCHEVLYCQVLVVMASLD